MIPCTNEFEFLAESMPQLVWTKNPDGTREHLNTRWGEYSGLSLDDSNWDWTDIIHPDDYEQTVTYWNESLTSGKFFEFECRLKKFDGSYRWHLARAIPVMDQKGSLSMWVGTCTDIHDNKIREEELFLKNKELEKINSDLDNFVYTASHDLKAPISNIEGLINALKDDLDKKADEDEKHLMEMIDSSLNKLKGTIYELTEISKIQRESYSGYNKEISVAEVFEEVKADMINQIRESGAFISTNFECPNIAFSHKDLRSILYNLLSNSIKFRNPLRKPIIQFSTYRENEFIVLSVRDNGLGVDITKKDKIFSMFRRLHTHVEGTGVGLYIVKRIVENWGGKIEVESEEGKGSDFKIYLKGINRKSWGDSS